MNVNAVSMKRIRSEKGFADYQIVHAFRYNEPLKAWIDESNYINLFEEDWNELMPVLTEINEILNSWLCESHDGSDKLEKWYLSYNHENLNYIENEVVVTTGIGLVYDEVIQFIKWYNEHK